MTASQLFLFEDHPEECGVMPIVLDELYDHEEREKEQRQGKMEDMMIPAMSIRIGPFEARWDFCAELIMSSSVGG